MTELSPAALAKTFDPAAIESKWYAHWESSGAFRPSRPDAVPFTIVNPPPNVTGSLHIGHALDNTLQDILIRHARLQGKDALWVVGTDHAGIATQMVVERQMALHQQKRNDFTRDEFVAKVWEWKEESGGEITQQLRRLGCSMDWANERFTMDEGFSTAVTKVFVDLYNEGLLYRDKRLVNWDPGLKTAISDLEVETREVNGKFWHFKYPLEDGSGFISVATTRPETMLADMRVAVNAKDERYTAMVGKMVRLPITGRLIEIVTDDHADPELGSGAVKITPGHDFNDFEVGKRVGIKPADMLNMLDAEANVVQTSDGLIPNEFLGLHRFRKDGVDGARELVVARAAAQGWMVREPEDRVIQTPYGDRSGVAIEPWLTDQWYVDAKTLAGPAIEAVRSGAIEVVPKSWEKTYFNWMENIQPWCVSRQLWWGHRIPAWYCADRAATEREVARLSSANPGDDVDLEFFSSFFDRGHTIIALDENEARHAAAEYFRVDPSKISFAGESVTTPVPYELERDSDVLDTWFSSALWPFGTLGWPGEQVRHPGEGRDPYASPSPVKAEAMGPGLRRGDGDAFDAPSSSLLQRHYPGDVLVSGFDILFFWDARMIMQGLHFMKKAPFKTLYLHGLVRAADGSKMSKSKGNTVDPLGLIDQYGADALRFFMAAMESQGRDIKMDEERVKGYRNFATKLWNAARFCQANGIGASATVAAPVAELAVNKWIIGEVVETLAKLNRAFEELRFDGMADTIYHFAWGTFCDWYLELSKIIIQGDGLSNEADECRLVSAWVFDQILVMLHPFMPFITEELWSAMGDRGGNMLIHAHWPLPEFATDVEATAEIAWVIGLISKIRSERTERDVPPSAKLELRVTADSDPSNSQRLNRNQRFIERLGRISEINQTGPEITGSKAPFIFEGVTYILILEGAVDSAAERARLTAAIAAITKERDSLAGRLGNPAFVEKAKPEAVEKARADHGEKVAEAERLTAALERLG